MSIKQKKKKISIDDNSIELAVVISLIAGCIISIGSIIILKIVMNNVAKISLTIGLLMMGIPGVLYSISGINPKRSIKRSKYLACFFFGIILLFSGVLSFLIILLGTPTSTI